MSVPGSRTIQPNHDGRIVLCKDTLKTLRRKLGASQEKVAFLCAEQGLCVSIASLKRAETSKNILYRTARDLARFYQVSVDDLVAGASSAVADVAEDSTPSAPRDLAVVRHFLLLGLRVDGATPDEQVSSDSLLAVCQHLATQYGAELLDAVGGRLFFSFGLNRAEGNEAVRAVGFADRCLRLLDSMLGPEAQARAALSLGSVIGREGLEADIASIEPAQWQANAAIFDAAPAGGLYMSDAVYQSLGGRVACEPVAALWRFAPDADTRAASPVPFVGRRVELTLFKAVLESASAYDDCQVVHLVAPPGIGKSRLAEEFRRVAELDGFVCHAGHMFDFQVERQQRAIPTLLRSLLGVAGGETDVSIETLNRRGACGLLPDSADLPLLYALLGWRVPGQWNALLSAMTPETLRDAQCQLLAKLLRTRAGQSPLLLTLEDYHWSDPQERHYLHAMIRASAGLPVVWLLTTRPGDAARHLAAAQDGDGAAVTNIRLGPLPQGDARALAVQFAGASEDYRSQCIDKAQGNPLFLLQLLQDSRDGGQGLPFSLQNLIAARVDRMSRQDQYAARAASVIGQRFSLTLLRHLLGDDGYDPTPLVMANLVNRFDDDYAFNHALIAEGIYQSIAVEDQRRLHHACAQWYADDVALQCRHLLRARHPEAAEKILPAIQFLLRRYQFDEAGELVRTGLDMIDQLHAPQRLHELAADVHLRRGETAQALTAFEAMRDSAEAPVDQANALIGMANCLNTLDRFEPALAALGEAEAVANDHNLIAQLSRVFYLKGNFLFPKGQAEACEQAQQKALYFAGKAGDHELEARALGGLGDAAYAEGRMVTAHRYFRRCLDLCERHDLKAVAAANLFMLGTTGIYLNNTGQALIDVEQSIRTAELVGHKRAEIVSRLTAGWILLDALRLSEAQTHIDAALALAREIGAQRFVPFLQESEARRLHLSGETARARAVIGEAIAEVDALAAQAFIGPWLLGTAALLSESFAEAEPFLNRGEAVIEAGCIGHNMYRFHVAAMDTALKHGRGELALAHADKLARFSRDEPCPWSDFHIARARCLAGDGGEREALMAQAREAMLLAVLPGLEAAGASV